MSSAGQGTLEVPSAVDSFGYRAVLVHGYLQRFAKFHQSLGAELGDVSLKKWCGVHDQWPFQHVCFLHAEGSTRDLGRGGGRALMSGADLRIAA